MRGSVAKKLRRFAKADMEETPWVEYSTIKRSPHSEQYMVVLDQECGRSYYKMLKRIWKFFP